MTPSEASPPTFRVLRATDEPPDLTRLYAPQWNRRESARHVRVNMIASVDGGTSADGTSGALGGPADRVIFGLVRSFADVVVVGAGTMRAEQYGPAQLSEETRQARLARGQTPVPPIAVITRSANLDWESAFFTEAEVRPIVLTVEASRDRHAPAARVADVILAGSQEVDLALGLDELARRGYRDVLVEGGPIVNAELAALDAIDELCLTISPLLLGGMSSRILKGEAASAARQLELVSSVTADGFVFLRYRRAPARL
jgi:riboflavin biosynthesis pyrimidine reductase